MAQRASPRRSLPVPRRYRPLTRLTRNFVGEQPGSGMWHTGESEDGDEVDGLIGSSNNWNVKISYDDDDRVVQEFLARCSWL